MTTPQPKKESNAVKLERHNSDVDDLQPVNDLLVEQKTVDISRETGEINQKNKIQYQNVTHAESLKNALTNTMTAAYPKPKQKAIPGKRAAASFESKHPKKKMKVEQDSELKQTIHPNYNEHITKILEELGVTEKNKGQHYKYRAYMTAVNSLKAYPKAIESGKEAQKLPGIGAKIAKKIQEILDTGKLIKFEQQKEDEQLQALNLISRVSGIGPAFAKKLVYEEGVRTLQDIVTKNIKLNHHQQIGLKYFDAFEQRIPRDEIKQLKNIVKDACQEIDPQIIVKCCGSYRRKLPTSGDLDILLTHPKYTIAKKTKGNAFDIIRKLITKLKERKFLIDDISCGPVKYMGVCRLNDASTPRRVDLKLFPFESFYCGLIHFTGSGEFNRQLRAVALKKGFRLNEYGIYPEGTTGEVGDPIPVQSEREVFEILGVPYKKPEERSF